MNDAWKRYVIEEIDHVLWLRLFDKIILKNINSFVRMKRTKSCSALSARKKNLFYFNFALRVILTNQINLQNIDFLHLYVYINIYMYVLAIKY